MAGGPPSTTTRLELNPESVQTSETLGSPAKAAAEHLGQIRSYFKQPLSYGTTRRGSYFR